jgi:hypothetical protein
MKYMLLVHLGDSPTRNDPEAWGRLSQEEQDSMCAEYRALAQIPGVTPGHEMSEPDTGITVRVQDDNTVTAQGSFVPSRQALAGYLVCEAEDIDTAIAVAARVPAARMGGAVEVRPIITAEDDVDGNLAAAGAAGAGATNCAL